MPCREKGGGGGYGKKGIVSNKEKRWWFKKVGPAQAPLQIQKGPRPPHLEGRVAVA